MTSEGCNEARLVAFLVGDLDSEAAAVVDVHLLGCDSCWAAVQEDRRGRDAAALLQEAAPADVRERLRRALARGRTDRVDARRRRPTRRTLTKAAVAIAATTALAAVGVTVWPSRRARDDPGAVAAIVRLAAGLEGAAAPQAAALRVWRTRSASGLVVIAESDSSFPMPSDARLVRTDGGDTWLAHRGGVHLLCVMSPRHALLAGAVSDAELAAVARAYGFIT